MRAIQIPVDHQAEDQVFSYYHGEEMLHFNASLLARIREAAPDQFRLITLDIEQAIYDMFMANRGIEENRIRALEGKHLRDPGYGVMLDGQGTFTVVDGHHRLVRRFRGGLSTMDFHVTDRSIWQHCLVYYPKEFEEILAQDIPKRVDNPGLIASSVTIHGSDKR